MDLVICMAGKNTRFHDLGYDVPKYLLPFPKNSVIQKIISALISDNFFDEVFLIAHERDLHFKPELLTILNSLSIDQSNLFYIGETRGQAETAYLATKLINRKEDNQIVFNNADTVIQNRNFSFIKTQLSNDYGYVDAFYSNSENYSYVKLNENNVVEIAEKKVISQHATSGLYGFASIKDYQKYYLECRHRLDTHDNDSEIYISDVIEYMISKEKIFKTNTNTGIQDTVVLGSPKEYIEALKNLEGTNNEI